MNLSPIPTRLLALLTEKPTITAILTLAIASYPNDNITAYVVASYRQFLLGRLEFLDVRFQSAKEAETGHDHENNDPETVAATLEMVNSEGSKNFSESLGSYAGLHAALGLSPEFETPKAGDTLRYAFLRPIDDHVLGRRDWLKSRFQGAPGVVWIQDIPDKVNLEEIDYNVAAGTILFRPDEANPNDDLNVLYDQRLSDPPLVTRQEVSMRTLAIITIGDNYGFSNYDLRKTLFNSAAGLNLRVVVVDRPDHWLTYEDAIAASGMPFNRRPFAFIPFDFTDQETVDSRLTKCLKEWQASPNGVILDGIITFRDNISVAVARTAISLGLPVPAQPEALERCINKQKMRDLIPWNGQKARTISDRKDIDSALLEGLLFPAVIKPRSGNGSLGVFKVVSAKELYHVWDSVTFPSAVAVIEPYVGGTEVDVDLILEKGRLLYFGVTDNDPTIGDEYEESKERATERTFTETAMFIPTVLPEDIQNRLRDTCYEAAMCVGLDQASGVFNIEARIGNTLEDLNGPIFVVEINVRCPGSNFPLLVQRAWGVDQYGCAFLAALGRSLSIACAPFSKPLAYGSVTWVPTNASRVLARDPLEKVMGRADLLSASSWPKGFDMKEGPDWIAKLYTISSKNREDCAERRRFLESEVVQVFEDDKHVINGARL